MNSPRWFFHPMVILIISVVALGTSLILYIYWYLEASIGLQRLMEKMSLDADQVIAPQTWVVVLVLSLLVGVILIGFLGIYLYERRTTRLFRLQHNFINNFTHELRTPVTSLKLFLETLSKHELPPKEQHKYLRLMLTDVNRLSDQIERILNLAKIETKHYHHQRIDTDIWVKITEFYEKNSHLFGNSQITVHPPKTPVGIYPVNPDLFDMLLMNLTTNAVKYNDAPTPTLDIHFNQTHRKQQILFEDNGIGIEKKELRNIFRRFYQIGRAENRTAKGSGLGLHLVQTITRIHGWKVTVASDGPNHGACFTLLLPLDESSQP